MTDIMYIYILIIHIYNIHIYDVYIIIYMMHHIYIYGGITINLGEWHADDIV